MPFYRVNPDGTETPVEGNPFGADPQGARLNAEPQSRTEPTTQQVSSPAEPSGEQPMGWGDTLVDYARSVPSGLRIGAEGIVGLPGEAQAALKWLMEKGTGIKVPETPLDQPRIADIHKDTSALVGESYEPKSLGGKYLKTGGEFAAGLPLGGMANLGRRAISEVIAPALASETAGQMTKDTGLEPYARMLAGLVGGVGANLATEPRQALTAAQTEREDLLHAAARQNIDMPSYMMPDAAGQRVTAQRLGDLPLVGDPVRQSSTRTANQIGERVQDIARQNGNPDYTAATVRTGNALDTYMGTTMRDRLRDEYQAVDQLITHPNMRVVPQATRLAINDLMADPSAAMQRVNGRVADLVNPDVQRNGGMTYEQTKRLRSYVGGLMNDNTAPEFSSIQPALRRLYGTLSDDLENVVLQAGGPQAHQQWQMANTVTRAMKEVGEDVQKVAGTAGDVQPDRIMKQLRQLTSMRDDSTRNRLNMLRIAIDEADPTLPGRTGGWDDIGSAFLGDLGNNPKDPGRFDPAHYVANYDKMAAEGREIIWPDAGLRRAAADLATLSRAFVDAREPSRWGLATQAGSGGLLAAGTVLNWPAALGAVLTSNGLARVLSRPAGAQKLLSWARTMQAGRRVAPNITRGLAADIAREEGGDPADIEAKLKGEGDGRW